MPKKKTLIGGGTTLIATAVGLYASGWPEHIRAHPWMVLAVALTGLALIVYGLFFSASSTRPSGQQTIETGGNVTGSQFQAGRDIHYHEANKAAPQDPGTPETQAIASRRLYINFAEYIAVDGSGEQYIVTDCLRQLVNDDRLVFDVENHNFRVGGRNFVPQDPRPNLKKKLRITYSFNGGPLQTVERVEGSRLELPESTKKIPARIEIRREWRNVIYEASPGIWRLATPDDPRGLMMLLVWVNNPYPETKGVSGTSLSDIIAHVKIENYEAAQVTKAYWLEEFNNRIDLGCGSERAVIVGHFGNGSFVSYENPYSPEYRPYFEVPYRELGEARAVHLIERNPSIINIRVSIVSSASNEVIEYGKLKIHLPARITELVYEE